MNKLNKQYWLKLAYKGQIVITLFTVLLFNSCNDDDLTSESFTIGDELVESSTQIIYFDTLSVELSTVILDSVISSGYSTVLIGEYTDGEFGTINSRSYFQLSPLEGDFIEDDTYDSITLVMKYNGYSYGDTLVEQILNVYELSENIDLNNDGYLYTTSGFSYSKTLLGQLSYFPEPSTDYIEFRLSDDLGKDLFDKFINEDDAVTSTESFLDYFPGLMVEAESSGNSSIIGFSTGDTNIYISLHYHRNGFEMEELEAKISLYDEDYQFNQVSVDRSGTQLSSWTEERESISANQTYNQVFVQGLTGILTRIEFPTLETLIEFGDRISLIKAEIYFEPVKGTYNEITIPTNTVLYMTDRINRIYEPIYSSDGTTTQQGATSIDNMYHENTNITFDLTNYFRYDFLDNYYDEDYGFLLGLSEPEIFKTFDRLILGGLNHAEHKPKLRVYYILYD